MIQTTKIINFTPDFMVSGSIWGTFIRFFFVENSTLSDVSCIPPVSDKKRTFFNKKEQTL